MKRTLFIAFWALTSVFAFAQEDEQGYVDGAWDLKGVTGINLSQTSLSNWSAGGENSMAGNIYLNGGLKRKSGNWLWVNTLVLEYGLSKIESDGTKKTNDNIDFSTQLGYSTNNKLFYTAMGSFKTQFYKGYNYPDKSKIISDFMAPAYSNLSLGLEYRPKSNYSIFFSPASAKLTFVEDDYLSSIGAFGVDPGDKFKAEIGTYLKARLEQGLMENVNLISTLDLFTAYDKSFGNIDVNWDVLISMKINKYLSATLNATLKYDDDVKATNDQGQQIGPKIQFKEILGVGIAYNF
ncbi:DUF3078 domain-containing protein [Massilibacteroides sp.]|uniref:DUF3078 domain-containing protein n=1 Tax=Massilibacteroides sp. TaxID=2034766 RepID=UPI00262C33A3|nr:DUF3078 domain-containing protein [Massilibacteroides sp.]MDD4515032.1 DUF3078 domain-containing protein [Massilibacteroides sp.]